MSNNKTKLRLECVAPQELTKYNKEYNEEIEAYCWADEKFSPHLYCDQCKYLKVKRYT